MASSKEGSLRKRVRKRQPANTSLPKPLGSYLALVEADRWLFMASLALGEQADLLAAVEHIRRNIGARLSSVQASAYQAWSREIAGRHSQKK